MNILVTGCNGQLGTEIRRLSSYHPKHHYVFTDVAELDITDAEAIRTMIEANAIDCIINCAAYTAVDKAESDSTLAHRLNADGPRLLAEAIGRVGGLLIHISTDYVFDGTACRPYTEDCTPNPQSVYGRTKLAGEEAVMVACPRCVILRTAWLYSPYGNNFVKTMLRLGRERDALGVVADQIGTPTYAADLASAIFSIIDGDITTGIFHFSNEGAISWYDFTKAIHRLGGIQSCDVRPIHTEDYPTPAPRPHYSVLDKTKIKNAYNLTIPYWEESLARCIQLLNQENPTR